LKEIESKLKNPPASEKQLMVLYGPSNLKECYKMKEIGIVPDKILFFHDFIENMRKYHADKEGINLGETNDHLYAEKKELIDVLQFYKGCCFTFSEDQHYDTNIISV